MKWQFADNNTLVDEDSGFKIHLLLGTWFHPGKLKSETPEGMEYADQLKILKSGLRHMRSIGKEREINTRRVG
jgi:hypothetical protein